MTATSPVLRGTGEIIAALPHQLGHRPRHSLVVVLLRADAGRGRGSVIASLRIDLPPPGAEEAVVGSVAPLLRRERPDVLIAIAYEDGDEDAVPVLRALQERCAGLGVAVDTLARVRGTRWRRVEEPDGSAPVWRDLPRPRDVPAVAELVARGAAVGRDRDELVRLLEVGRPLVRRAVLEELVGRPIRSRVVQVLSDDELAAAAQAAGQVMTPADPEAVRALPARIVADVVVGLEDKGFRDAVIGWVCPGLIPPSLHDERSVRHLLRLGLVSRVRGDGHLVERLVQLVVQVPRSRSAPVLTTLGQVAWWHGEGMVANVAIERALQVQADYYLAQLVDRLLEHSVRPPWPHRGVA